MYGCTYILEIERMLHGWLKDSRNKVTPPRYLARRPSTCHHIRISTDTTIILAKVGSKNLDCLD